MDKVTGLNRSRVMERIRAMAELSLQFGKPISIVVGMALSGLACIIAASYMPSMLRMAKAGWQTTHYAMVNYGAIKWTPESIEYTAIHALEFVGGAIAYVGLLIPVTLSAISFLRGGVRLTRLIAGR